MEPKGIVAASVPQWISVKDGLPEPGVHALVYTPDAGIFIDFHDGFEFGIKDATHWMPLPEPPKEV